MSKKKRRSNAALARDYKAALNALIESIDRTHAFKPLETGCDGEGAVVLACRAMAKPLPPNLRVWLRQTGEIAGAIKSAY